MAYQGSVILHGNYPEVYVAWRKNELRSDLDQPYAGDGYENRHEHQVNPGRLNPENQDKSEIGTEEEENKADKIGQDLGDGTGEFFPAAVIGYLQRGDFDEVLGQKNFPEKYLDQKTGADET